MDTSSIGTQRPITVVGHRGARGHAPENTLRSFATAIEMGCQRVEMDVHLSRDGVPMIIHDGALDRTTNGTGPVAQRTHAELRLLDAGGGERIPTLGEVMDFCRGRVDIQIELKDPRCPGTVADQILRDWGLERLVVTSFTLELLDEIAPRLPEVPLGLLNKNPARDMIGVARDRGHQLICPRSSIASPDLIAQAHDAGLQVYVFHVNTADAAADAIRFRADAIGTDYPDLVFRQLAGR